MLALITGSGFYDLAQLQDRREQLIETPWGWVTVLSAQWNGESPVLFLPRHGSDHSIAPHLINYRANMWALNEAGATAVVATAVCGGMAEPLVPGAFCLIDDFIDYTEGRPRTFFETPGEVRHTDMSRPYSPELGAFITAAAQAIDLELMVDGVYCATNGPRFETRAEIAMMAAAGGDLVGMTGCPEVVLANELGLPYASIGVISNRAVGMAETELSMDEIMQVLAHAKEPLQQLLGGVVERYQS